jgi:nucleotide-binding universal stress UspA family protein
MSAIHKILVPTDFSPHSDYAYRLASSLARDHGAHLVLLHVRPPVVVFGEMYPLSLPDPAEERQRLLEQLRELYPADPVVRVEPLVKDGDPVEEILDTAREVGCDLIVLGTHGRTGLGRLVFGSVAEKVLRRACCPVLAVKTPLERGAVSESAGVASVGA